MQIVFLSLNVKAIRGQINLVAHIQAIYQDEIFFDLAPYLKFCKSKVR